MRQKMFLLLVGLVCALGIFVPAVSADCTVTGGTAPNEIYTCDGTDVDGVDVGGGVDIVTILANAIVQFVITSSNGDLILIIEPGGVLDSIGTGISLTGNGTITSIGDIEASNSGIWLEGNGSIISAGDIRTGDYGVILTGDGSITSIGSILAPVYGISLGGDGNILSVGNIDAGVIGLVLVGNGNVLSAGNIDAGSIGIYLHGDGTITSYGSIVAEHFGIRGGDGTQQVDLSGSVSAPLAVSLAAGNDSLMIRSFTIVDGEIRMGDGDDVVVIENYVQVDGTIYGGEGAEVDGDLLVLGSGEFCSEDEALAAGLGINKLNPNSGTTTYLGQTYTWAEFERLGRDATVVPCIGKIDDGRINAYDLGAPEALYCTVENGVSVWELDLEGRGTFSFAVSKAQIEAAFATATSSGVNTLIGSDSFGNELYALSDGTTITFVSPELREPEKTYMTSFERTTCG